MNVIDVTKPSKAMVQKVDSMDDIFAISNMINRPLIHLIKDTCPEMYYVCDGGQKYVYVPKNHEDEKA